MSLDVPPALAEPVRRVGPWWITALALVNLGLLMGYMAPLQVLLPQQVAAAVPLAKEEALAWVTGAGALVAMVANPIAGAFSDRTVSRFGRRRPWVLAGGLLSGAALAFLAVQSSVVWIAVGWCLAQVALNSMQAAAAASVPDQVPVSQRGEVSGWIGVPQTVGVVAGVVLVTVVVSATASGYLLLAAVIPLLVLPFVLATPDPRSPVRPRIALASFWISPRAHPDFCWAWVTRFLMNLGNSVVLLYLLYFLQDAVGYERLFPGERVADGLLLLILIYTVFTVLTTVAAGIVSDRLGRRRTLVTVSGVVSALPALALAFWPEWAVVVAGAAVLGAGFGVYMSVDNALVTEVLPAADARAKDLGVINIAGSGPQVVAPVIAGPIVAGLGGYPALFLVSALLSVAGAGLVWKIRGVR